MLILKEYLTEKGISLSHLHRMMTDKGYTLARNSISNIVHGVHSPRVETLEQIADTLGINVRDLFSAESIDGREIYIKDPDGSIRKIGHLEI